MDSATRSAAPLHQQQNWTILLRREPSVRPNCLSIKNARYAFRLFEALPVQSLGKRLLQSTAYRRSGPRTIKACHLEAGESRHLSLHSQRRSREDSGAMTWAAQYKAAHVLFSVPIASSYKSTGDPGKKSKEGKSSGM